MYRNVILALSICTASPVLAEEVLHCVDTAATGFRWDNGTVNSGKFGAERYTVKVVSESERLITRMVGDTAGATDRYNCIRQSPNTIPDRITCRERYDNDVWLFYRNTYTRAFLAGPPAGGGDPNIWIAKGTCTKS